MKTPLLPRPLLPLPPTRAAVAVALAVACGCVQAHPSGPGHAQPSQHQHHPQQPAPQAAASAPADRPAIDWPPVAARYSLQMTPHAPTTEPVAQTWYLYRSAHRIHLVKGAVEEVWARDAHGQVSFERVFHADQRRVHYSPGELRTLGVVADWDHLALLADTSGVSPEAASGTAAGRASSSAAVFVQRDPQGQPMVETTWDAVHQLPLAVRKRLPNGELRFTLQAAHAVAPADWPIPGRGEGYLQLDAADLADMEYDPFARKAAAYDVRAGWRVAHTH